MKEAWGYVGNLCKFEKSVRGCGNNLLFLEKYVGKAPSDFRIVKYLVCC